MDVLDTARRAPAVLAIPASVLFAGMLGLMLLAPAAWAQTTYYSQATGDFNVLGNWNTVRTGGGSVPSTFDGHHFVIQDQHTMTTSAAITGITLHRVEIENGGMISKGHAVPATTLTVRNGGTWRQTGGASVSFGSAKNLEAESIVDYHTTTGFVVAGVTYGHLWISSGTINIDGATTFVNAQGNLEIKGGTFRPGQSTASNTHSIAGDLILSGGTLELSTSSGNPTYQIGGSLLQIGGTYVAATTTGRATLTFTGSSATIELGGTVSNAQHHISVTGTASLGANLPVTSDGTVTVNGGGTLHTGTRAVTGTGDFVLALGGTLGVGSPDGITTAPTATGNIQTTGRTFSGSANYVYNGVTAQVTGNALTETNDLTIDNAAGVSMSTSVDVHGELDIANGALAIGGHFLTLFGTVTGTGTLTGSTGANLDLAGGIPNAGTITFTPGSEILRILRVQSGTTLGSNLDIGLVLWLSAHTLALDGHTLTLLSDASVTATIQNGGGSVDGPIVYQRRYAHAGDGWRMLGSPFAATPFTSLRTSDFHTQGASNTEYAWGDPILYWYDPSEPDAADRWKAVPDYADAADPGLGYIFYMYTTRKGAGGAPHLPGTWTIAGSENSDNVIFSDLHFDPVESDRRFHLLSNPHGGNLDWNAVTRSNFSDTYQVWDPDTETYIGFATGGADTGAGRYIAPFQGFWVETTDATNSIEFTYAMKANFQSPVYVGRPVEEEQEAAYLLLQLEGEGLKASQPALIFNPSASAGADPYDASWLTPLVQTYAALWFEDELDRRLIFESRPPVETEEVYRLAFETTRKGTYTLSWPTWHEVPESWSLVLTDIETGEEVDLRNAGSFTFATEATAQARPESETALPASLSAPATLEPRFQIAVRSQGVSVDGPGSAVPVFALEAVYPNPFSGTATIAFELPAAGAASLVVYDVLGRRVAELAEGDHEAGRHTVSLDASGLASGVYVVHLVAGEHVASRRLTVTR